jgi:hypothetical protein
LLSGQELADHLLHVSVACTCTHHQESFLGLCMLLHLLLHLFLIEFTPSLLDEELSAHLSLILVLRLVLGLLPNLVLIQFSVVTLLDGVLFVFDRGIEC